MDRSAHPPVVSYVHHVFDDWLGDAPLESFPVFIVTEQARRALVAAGVTGADFGALEVGTSGLFDDIHPGRTLPEFAWLRVVGQAAKDDFGLHTDHRLVISERALNMLRGLGLEHASVEPLGP